MPTPAFPVPVDFADRYLCSNPDLAAHYGVCINTIKRWRRKSGLRNGKRGGVDALPVPADFAEVAPTMNIDQCSIHYGRSATAIKRWIAVTGIKTGAIRRPRLAASRSTRNFNPTNVHHYDDSEVGRAVDYLQRFGEVRSCGPDGSYQPRFLPDGRRNPRAGFWTRRTSAILTDEEIIERADWNRQREAARRNGNFGMGVGI